MLNDQIQSLKRMTRQPETKTTAPLRSDRGVSLRSVLSSPTPGNSISATNYRTPLGNHSHGRSQGPPLFSITENRSFASPGYGQMGSPIVPLSANKSSMSIVLASPFPTPTRSAVTPGSHLRVTQSQQLATPDKSKDADGGKLALSEEDKQSCLKLLSAQTDLLSNSDEKLKALEQRLLALKARK